MKSLYPSTNKMQLTIVFITYLIFALIFGFAYRFAMNPDGISELRLAGYLAEGNFLQSVSSGYSPFIIWLYSAFIFLGFDGLTSARIAIALCGAGLLLCSWFLAQRFDLSQNIRFIAMLIAAPLIAFWTIQFISSDVLFAALILCYIYLVTDINILDKKTVSFLCGVAGGFSYLAHHYALPFFLVHFPVLLLTRGYIDKDNEGFLWKKVLISWGSGLMGFLIITSVWVSILSAKYGHLTISIKGGAAHAVLGPKDIDRRHPFFVGGLFKPRDDYAIHVFEDPSEVEFKTWSPFESKEYFIYQLKVIKINAEYILNHFVNKSPFFTYTSVIGILVLIPIAFLLNPLNNKKKFFYAWVATTFSIYCSGFLLIVARSPRRFYALMIVFLLLSFHFMEELINAFSASISERSKKILTLYLMVIVCSAFAIKPCVQLLRSIKNIVTVAQVQPYKEIAEQINTVDFRPPYAIIRSSQKLTTDYYMTYFLKKQLLGRPMSTDLDGITKELNSAGGKSLLVFDNPELTEKLKLDERYVHLASITLKSNKRYEHAANWIIAEHEIITGWDDEVNIFTFK
ncbi:MAG: hypothetical protein HY757_04605 [Nitrospirae bacterium]|nr:hypothetical protein [Nitrospirota bacterium]